MAIEPVQFNIHIKGTCEEMIKRAWRDYIYDRVTAYHAIHLGFIFSQVERQTECKNEEPFERVCALGYALGRLSSMGTKSLRDHSITLLNEAEIRPIGSPRVVSCNLLCDPL